MDLHQGETLLFEGRPSWRSILGFYIVGWLLAVAIGAVVGLVSETGTGVIVGVIGVLLVLIVGFVRRVGTRYAITTQRLNIRRGIIARHVQETRLDRAQNVNTNQRMLERMLRVGTVDFDTAGSGEKDADFAFRGVGNPAEVARRVDDAIRRTPPEPTQTG